MATDRRTSIRASQLKNFTVTGYDIQNASISGSEKLIDNTVSESKLEIVNNPVDGYYLQYTAASGMEWSESGVISDHGGLSGLSDDDHTHYILVSGTRAFTGNIQANASGTLDIGSSTVPFANMYADTLIATDAIEVGVDDTRAGIVHIYGGNEYGERGALRLYEDAVADVANNYYEFKPMGDGLYIGSNVDPDSLYYYRSGNIWNFTNGSISVGLNDSRTSYLYMYASVTTGPYAYFYTPANFDSTINYYQLHIDEDDFLIGPSTNPDMFKIDGATGSVIITTNLVVDGTISGALGTSINEFSTDGTMADNSDDAVPTEQAVVEYVTSEINTLSGALTASGVLDHGNLAGLSDDDHTQYILHTHGVGTNNLVGGSGAGDSLEAGSGSNVLLGYQSGDNMTTAGNSVVIGYQAGKAIQSADGAVVIGHQAAGVGSVGATGSIVGSVAIGNLALYKVQDGAQRNVVIGETAGYELTTGGFNIFIGQRAGRGNQTGSYNVVIGREAGGRTSGTFNYSSNVMVGDYTGHDITSAANLVAVGANALQNITTGTSNTAVGTDALGGVTDGTYNTALGRLALASLVGADYNVGVGYLAGRYNTSGNYNTSVGYQAGLGASGNSNSNNVFIGASAGSAITTGSNNILIGYKSGDTLTTESDKLYIANDTGTPLIYGEFDNNLLKIDGDILPAASGTYDLGSAALPWKDIYVENGTIYVGTDTIIKDGQIGVGNASPPATSALYLRDDTNCILTIDSDGGLDAVIDFYQNGDSVAAIGYDDSSAALKLAGLGGLGQTSTIATIKNGEFTFTDTGNTLMFLDELSSGDPSFGYKLAGITKATHGVDNSDSDKWKLSVGGTFSAHTVIAIDPSSKATTFVQGTVALPNGTSINEFSTDGTMAGNSDDAVPTEQAVVEYVTGEINTLSGSMDHGGLNGLADDDHTQYLLADGTRSLSGDLDINGKNINYGPVLSASGTYSGDIMTVTVDDANAAFGNALYCAADFHYERADATASGTMPCRMLALESGAGSKKVLLRGQICNTSWNWSVGDIYVSTTTGELTQIPPSSSGEMVQIIGHALSANTMFFDPDTSTIVIS